MVNALSAMVNGLRTCAQGLLICLVKALCKVLTRMALGTFLHRKWLSRDGTIDCDACLFGFFDFCI